MKIPLAIPLAALALCAIPAMAGEPEPEGVVGAVQDERLGDVEAVQAAIKAAPDAEARARIVAAFQQREAERAAAAGAAGLQAELARQGARQPPAAAQRETPAAPEK